MAFQIKFHQIRAFVEVAREGSIRGASRSLAISQRRLGTREVMLIHHTDCGMQKITDDGFRTGLTSGKQAVSAHPEDGR